MAFPQGGRNERKPPVIEPSCGGNALARYIRKDVHQIPGYTGHVPGRKIEPAGLGRTYGEATSAFLNGEPISVTVTPIRKTTDFRSRESLSIGRYTLPGKDKKSVYISTSKDVLGRAASVSYGRRWQDPPNKSIPGYLGHVPRTQDIFGGPGDIYRSTQNKQGYSLQTPPVAQRRSVRRGSLPAHPRGRFIMEKLNETVPDLSRQRADKDLDSP
eukprot:m.5812 g.5812  ORF g.5812 m.5812 type:complete len:214 (-) comp3404_c0_seq1:146-787(-)